jgi:glucose/arabinose dehydrogenase
LTPSPTPDGTLPLTLIESGFERPVFLTNAGGPELFVVEQAGKIKIVGGGTFLDIVSKVVTSYEQGMLGLAFDPDYANNRLFYVTYTRAGDGALTLAEYRRSVDDPSRADESSERIVMTVNQPTLGHHGGMILFKDGLLYMTIGDGNNGQRLSLEELRGKILRINPHNPDGGGAYSVPDDNPYVGKAGRDEVWASGFRNPWRCSFDRLTGDLWCGDAGESRREEVDLVRKGLDYGWRSVEGTLYWDAPGHTPGDPCVNDCGTPPVLEYPHNMPGPDNNAVIGGYVSRRPGATLNGKYVFGDVGSGRVWIIPTDFALGDPLPAAAMTGHTISAFGEDSEGHLYLVTFGPGAVYRLDES